MHMLLSRQPKPLPSLRAKQPPSTSEMLKRERAWAYFVVGRHSSNRSLSETDAPQPRERRSDRSSSATD